MVNSPVNIPPIITSLLDTDLYKFTMMQCVWHQFPDAEVAYRFKCRRPVDLKPLKSHIEQQVKHLCSLKLQPTELDYLKSLGFFKEDFIEFLHDFQLNNNEVFISNNDNLEIVIQGNWVNTILFEVPLLGIVSEVYSTLSFPDLDFSQARKRLQQKVDYIKKDKSLDKLHFSDFGTRRRFSKVWQQEVIEYLTSKLPNNFFGTSNVLFAKQFGLNPIGTMAHEYLQACQVLAPDLASSQNFALNTWQKEYGSELSIALTDVIGMDSFLKEFSPELALSYKGLRQDSGDPFEWAEKALAYYKKNNIDASNKIFVFSDSLNLAKAAKIFLHFKDKCWPMFGIGTNLTNDVGPQPLDIVIKMTHTNGIGVVKISDSPGKTISEDESRLQYIKDTLNIT